jgi:hypothetical protein
VEGLGLGPVRRGSPEASSRGGSRAADVVAGHAPRTGQAIMLRTALYVVFIAVIGGMALATLVYELFQAL